MGPSLLLPGISGSNILLKIKLTRIYTIVIKQQQIHTDMKKNILFAISITALLFTACVDEIDLELDSAENTKLIVDGEITNFPGPQTIKLTLTSAFDSNQPCPPATGAEVRVTDGEQVYGFPEVAPGIYQSNDITGEVGKTYALSIWFGNQNYEATSTMSPAFVIDSVGFKKFPYGTPRDQPHWEIMVYGQDDPEKIDFQMFQYAVNGEWQDTLLYVGLYADWLSNGQYIEGESVAIYSSYEDSVEVKIRSISIEEQYLWFIDNVIWAVMPNMFFSPPKANIKGNVSNGALGYFRASEIYETEPYILQLYE